MHKIPYLERELSWLSFNQRVLQEAADVNVPVIERIRFLGIYSANLNEFFRVRVAEVRRKAILEMAHEQTADYWQQCLSQIIAKVNQLTLEFNQIAHNAFNALATHHIHTVFNDQHDKFDEVLSSYQLSWLQKHFTARILSHLTPVAINNKTHLISCLEEDGIYYLVALKQPETDKVQYALLEIPRKELERFIILPMQDSRRKKYIVLLDDVIKYYIDQVFSEFFDYQEIDAYSVELLRDAEYSLTDELDSSLLEKMSKGLKQRLKADPVRVSFDHNMPEYMQKFLLKSLHIKQRDEMMPGVKYRHFKDFIEFPNLGRKSLEKTKLPALNSAQFEQHSNVFSAIRAGDILLYYPYHKFKHFTEFVRQAAYDPAVEEIKINIYRVSKNSLIINSLIDAVKNGKQVTVVVELRARFDEQANIKWATRMKDAGIHVEFGIDTLKVHSKLCLISRHEQGKKRRYAHIGTGNFHENNARIYTDFALFTCHKEICREVEHVFEFISHSYKRFRFNHLIVSPLTSRRRLYQLIDHEIAQAELGKKAKITLKVNNLVDDALIKRLYQANNAGVEIKLIVRGVCSLVTGIKGYSEHIKAISIVDRFLEHPRVMHFYHSGENLVFISSGDWMQRNIDHRVEVGCPIYNETLKQRILHILALHFKDNTKARVLDQYQQNNYVARGNKRKVRSQIAIYDYLVETEKT